MMNHAPPLRVSQLFLMASLILCCVLGGCTSVVVRISAATDPTAEVPVTPNPAEPSPNLKIQVVGLNPKVPVRAVRSETPPPCATGNHLVRSIERIKQETISWCWAASAQMVMKAIDINFNADQCHIVSDVFKPNQVSSCCPNKTTAECLKGGWPEWAFREFGFETHKLASLNQKTLEDHICQKQKPIVFAQTFSTGGGHSMVIGGVKKSLSGEIDLKIYHHDPDLAYSPNAPVTDWYHIPFSELLPLEIDDDIRDRVYFYTDAQPPQ